VSVVQLADVKAQLNVTFTDDDALIQTKIDAAEDWISKFYTGPAPQCSSAPTPPTWPPNPMPAGLTEAVKMLAAHLYENREASLVGVTSSELPFGLMDLIAPYRFWSF
jgi:hypothetical protein